MRGAVRLLVCAAVAASLPACFTHDCEGDLVLLDGGGDFVDDQTWETSPLADPWLDYPGGRTWRFHIPKWEAEGRAITAAYAYISAAPDPTKPICCGGANTWSVSSGNLSELRDVSPGRFSVTNATCSALFVRVVAHAGPATRAVDSGAGDAQSE